jgi:hypothetical protein
MDNKLSELKDVADYWRKVKSGELPALGPNEISITVCTLDGAVSRMTALLAELEKKDRQLKASIQRESAARKGFDEQHERAEAAEAKLATPVVLPKRWDVSGQVNPPRIVQVQFEQQNRTHDQCAEAIRAAGFTVEGDE